MDDNRSWTLNYDEFKTGISDYGIELDEMVSYMYIQSQIPIYQHMQSLVIVSVIQQYQCPTYVHIAMTLYMQWVSMYRISSTVYKIILQETMQVFSLIYA